MIKREEFNASIDSGFFDDAIEYVDQLEEHIKHQSEQIECLEHNCKSKDIGGDISYKNYLKMVDSLEQHIKSLEAQLANTKQLTCGTCESLYTYKPKGYTGQAVINPYRCTKYDIEVYCNMSCTNYTPKDTQ